MDKEHVPVLIVGAGGAGLSLTLLLLQQGIQPLLIERREAISWVPRARNLNFRTLEVMRGLGLAEKVRAIGATISQLITRESLASTQEQIFDPSQVIELPENLSPDPSGWYCPQSHLEPLLLETIQQRGGDVRYNTELVSFSQDASSVTATLRERTTDRSYVIQADYLVAADGAHSHTRAALGIPCDGIGALPEYFIFVYFRAPWRELVAGHESDAFMIKNAQGIQGIFLVVGDDLGMFMITYRPAFGESLQDFTHEHCKDLVQKALGRPEMTVEIVDVAPWQPAENVARQFQQGRIFLLGDAAHTMPAYKGLGVNTAIQSAQNLGWKLASVLHKQATPDLLTTYHEERHPVGRFAARQSLTGPGAAWLKEGTKSKDLPLEKEMPFFYPIVGYRYRSQAIFAEEHGQAQDAITLLDSEELTGLPGTRVPHLWLGRQGQRISTLDLLDGRFILLAGPNGGAWCEAVAAVRASLGIKLAAYRIGQDADLLDLEHSWSTAMDVSPTGALLVRPDGFIAWRARELVTEPDLLLRQLLAQILCRATAPVSRS